MSEQILTENEESDESENQREIKNLVNKTKGIIINILLIINNQKITFHHEKKIFINIKSLEKIQCKYIIKKISNTN